MIPFDATVQRFPTFSIRHPYKMSRCLMSLLWFFIFIYFSFVIAIIALPFYMVVNPFTVCIPCCDCIANFLLGCIQFPRKCVEGMIDGNCFWE
ncbi:hypothetical protein PYW08_015932 [Mythimna loreyi]|uniref:Uncharacterized protein n=1 Tax=Mythimna loreyi TaxID=667449 RepID=A0ACC2QSP4_9NEOP|nr:hypothetical protein PYW08_015932 [Mythimna loreyi]